MPRNEAPANPASPSKPSPFRLPSNRPSLVHQTIQYIYLAFFLYVALHFYSYAMWAMGINEAQVSRPPAVEAFLPISALLAFKRLIFTGQYDIIHPAGLTILIMALVSALLFRKGFCGYLCPVGAASTLLDKAGKRLGIQRKPGKWLSALLSVPKYLLLAMFLDMVLSMNVRNIEDFLRTPYNMVADTKMLLFFLSPSSTVVVALGVLILGSMIVPSFWCRGFCPYGAMLGLAAIFSPVAVRRDETACVNCGKCASACPSRIPVHEKKRISGPDCVGCTECIGACPVEGCLSVRAGFTERAPRLPYWSIAAGTVGVVLVLYIWAVSSGHWHGKVPPDMLKMLHSNVVQMQHP